MMMEQTMGWAVKQLARQGLIQSGSVQEETVPMLLLVSLNAGMASKSIMKHAMMARMTRLDVTQLVQDLY